MDSISVNKSLYDIPLERITIARLEQLFSTTVKLTFNGKTCVLRLNPHHTGYTFMNISGRKYPAHRIVATVCKGVNIPELVVDHLCRNRSCIRPSHLEFVTEGVNVKRGVGWHHFKKLADKKYCNYGHSLGNAILSVRSSGTTKRRCRTCHMLNERQRRQYAKEIA